MPRRPVIDQALIDKQVRATIEELKLPLPRMAQMGGWHDGKAKKTPDLMGVTTESKEASLQI